MCAQTESDSPRVPLGFGGITASIGDHIAHFYRGSNQRFNVLGPYVAEGLRNGDKCVVIASPDVAAQLCEWLTAQGLNADEACEAMQLLLHQGEATIGDMRSMVNRIESESLKAGHKFVRWAGDMGWALAGKFSVSEMLRWEAAYDQYSVGWQMFALCQYDLTQFGGDVIVDALRSHPFCIMEEAVVSNPFHVSPETLLQELSDRN